MTWVSISPEHKLNVVIVASNGSVSRYPVLALDPEPEDGYEWAALCVPTTRPMVFRYTSDDELAARTPTATYVYGLTRGFEGPGETSAFLSRRRKAVRAAMR